MLFVLPLLLLAVQIDADGAMVQRTRILHALFNNGGVRGNITFEGPESGGNVTILVHLSLVDPSVESKSFSWGIYSFPVFFDGKSPCASSELGTTFHDLSKRHGPITISAPQESSSLAFLDDEIELRGPNTIWGRSVLLKSSEYNTNVRSCANIASDGSTKTVEVTFSAPVVGSFILRQGELGETTIFANVFHSTEEYMPPSSHEWRILATDILDTTSDTSRKSQRRCDYLQVLFDPNNVDDRDCSNADQTKCKIGDMTRKHGLISVGAANSRYSKRLYVDMNLPLSAVEGQRTLYLVLYEKDNPFRIMGCARMRPIMPKEVRAHFSSDSVKGHVLMSQSYRTQPTVVTVQLNNLRGKGTALKIHEFPVTPRILPDDELCSLLAVGQVYNPFEVSNDGSLSSRATSDEYLVGDLSGKFGMLDPSPLSNLYLGIHVDFSLPLFGTYSVIGRSIVLYGTDSKPWICASIGYPSPTRTAVATFVYPIAGRVIFRQAADDSFSDTTVFAQLHYVDGSVNNTLDHRWDVHDLEPGADFYNWTKRCESTGPHYNPHGVGVGRQYEKHCHPNNPLRCMLGDFTMKYKRVNIAATNKHGAFQNRAFYTDVQLPLSGWNKVLGKGLVIHDDHAPPHRGDRLACTGIRIVHEVRASVRRWYSGTSIDSNITGLVQFRQEFQYDLTEVKVDFSGLHGLASGYHVHEVWVPTDREFPCTSDSVYNHFNPFRVNVSLGPAPGVGSFDQYEVGDLSGKYGTLEDAESYRGNMLDVNLPLHGIHSIVGRSVVIHKKERNSRWACGTIVAEYKADISREVIGMASFDQPNSAIDGYIRLRQLEYADGGYGDTSIEVDLRYPKHNRNVSTGHNWAVFVNQVAHDAVEKVEAVRCIASGYRWNPYIIKSGDDSYRDECNVKNPFRCEMGDLSGRHGSLTIGSGKKIFTDTNLPLVGNYSVMGRSIIIFAKEGSQNKFACANIKPDVHLIRHVAIKKNPGFTASRFMDHMRNLLDTKDWLVELDTHSQRDILDGQCLQMSINFYGPDAHKHQIEFSNLVNLGSVQKSTRFGTKTIQTFYKPCRNLNDISYSSNVAVPDLILMAAVLLFLFWNESGHPRV